MDIASDLIKIWKRVFGVNLPGKN